MLPVALICEDALLTPELKKLNLPRCEDLKNSDYDYFLVFDETGLALHAPRKEGDPLRVDFQSRQWQNRLRRLQPQQELLARAIGFKANYRPTVLDATAGLGQDGYLLSQLSYPITLVERNPIVAALLSDGLRRSAHDPLCEKIVLIRDSAHHYLTTLTDYPDVITLDPMYPHRTHAERGKKNLRWLRDLVGDDDDAALLLEQARTIAQDRVIVKRPRKAEPLLPGPNFNFSGKIARFDVYLSSTPSPKK